jgi:hypothetical protein
MPLDLADLKHEIEAGLPNERDRMSTAWDNRRFAEGHVEEYSTKPEGEGYTRQDYRRTSRFMPRVVDTMTGYLYKRQPGRKVPGDTGGGTDKLAKIYQANRMAAKWTPIDKASIIGDFVGIRFAGGTNPLAPVKVRIDDADQLVIWLDPDDCTQPGAVAVVEARDASRTLKLWTPEKVVTYATDKLPLGLPGNQAGGTAYHWQGEVANPYRDNDNEGLLPFAFAHFEFPAKHFHAGGIGTYLREINDHVNYRLDSLSDAIKYLSRPIAVASDVAPGWHVPRHAREPGAVWNLSDGGAGFDANGGGPSPSITYLVAPAGFVESEWEDINKYLDHSLEMAGVPPGSIRFAEAAQSGIALVIKQGPIVTWAENRRTPFSAYESDAARVALLVAASHLENQGRDGEAYRDAADAVEADGLIMSWPRFNVLPPGPERDQADEFEVSAGYQSKIHVVMARFDYTREQAIEHLQAVAEDNATLEEMGIDPGSVPYTPPELAPPGDPDAPPAAPGEEPPPAAEDSQEL